VLYAEYERHWRHDDSSPTPASCGAFAAAASQRIHAPSAACGPLVVAAVDRSNELNVRVEGGAVLAGS
jgi:hypothetical protein